MREETYIFDPTSNQQIPVIADVIVIGGDTGESAVKELAAQGKTSVFFDQREEFMLNTPFMHSKKMQPQFHYLAPPAAVAPPPQIVDSVQESKKDDSVSQNRLFPGKSFYSAEELLAIYKKITEEYSVLSKNVPNKSVFGEPIFIKAKVLEIKRTGDAEYYIITVKYNDLIARFAAPQLINTSNEVMLPNSLYGDVDLCDLDVEPAVALLQLSEQTKAEIKNIADDLTESLFATKKQVVTQYFNTYLRHYCSTKDTNGKTLDSKGETKENRVILTEKLKSTVNHKAKITQEINAVSSSLKQIDDACLKPAAVKNSLRPSA